MNNAQLFSPRCFYCHIPWLVWNESVNAELAKPTTLSSAKEGAFLTSTLSASLRSDHTMPWPGWSSWQRWSSSEPAQHLEVLLHLEEILILHARMVTANGKRANSTSMCLKSYTWTHCCNDGALTGVLSQLSTINEEGSLVGMETSSAHEPIEGQQNSCCWNHREMKKFSRFFFLVLSDLKPRNLQSPNVHQMNCLAVQKNSKCRNFKNVTIPPIQNYSPLPPLQKRSLKSLGSLFLWQVKAQVVFWSLFMKSTGNPETWLIIQAPQQSNKQHVRHRSKLPNHKHCVMKRSGNKNLADILGTYDWR